MLLEHNVLLLPIWKLCCFLITNDTSFALFLNVFRIKKKAHGKVKPASGTLTKKAKDYLAMGHHFALK
jgi:hypothetical protein